MMKECKRLRIIENEKKKECGKEGMQKGKELKRKELEREIIEKEKE